MTNPYLVHPSATAAAIATLDEISEGRATLGISAGDPSYLESVGVKHEKPITAVREATQIIRGLLVDEKIEFSGEIFTCNKASLKFSPLHEIPIYVGGRKEQMMRLAGSIADGALFNASRPKDLEECTKFVKEGANQIDRDLKDFDNVAYMATSIDENREKARNKARSVTSFVAASAPDSTLEREDISKQKIENIQKSLIAGETKKAREEVTDKMIDVFSLSEDIEKLEDRIEELRKSGITQIVIGSIGPDTDSALEKIEKVISQYS